MRRALVLFAAVVLGLAVGFFTKVAPLVDERLNTLIPSDTVLSTEAAHFHATLHAVDLHADALLWPRDLTQRHKNGHVDIPRLVDGNVAVQVFSAVTKTPRGLNYESNSSESDNITLLAAAERYPLRAWTSLRERALWQARRLEMAVAKSNGRLRQVRDTAELASLFVDRSQGARVVGAVLATEGLHPLEGKLANLDTLFASGFRIFGLTHFFDNEIGGSAHGLAKGGLTPFGDSVLKRIEQLGGIVDVAHASPKLIADVLLATTRPLMVSHTGVQGTCPGARNLTDDQLRAIAARGGVVGIGYWEGAVCKPTLEAFSRAVVHAIGIAGEDHVSLGSDFDGSTQTPIHTGQLALVTQALQRAGLTESQVRKVIGENALRFLRANLPP